ncbi:MAG: hypothetical protein A3C43_04050 [Candidatus Schekmanbacteria bacterium RIFCSPHIGHO2_02_FULL_38_11]|uniref:PUA domain-containing protein n=1 Tax=Candidatus Schekmanbacteria bacterium RIFCSPLOWO2_12_FULL_38_15 TaxID=1817883 RepID=A0A1F7SH64_9BACT|nr:MAG: hypothetical protein A2043_04335 [Candidatus Schekmanbacteria bacterium GWA2_38_9]OGL49731.1 MAG: hypothetical protein A3H37_01745 [Candidatus Schekmanbacteria bacterium RIFCSPLOWO2_02_FULL_38_14]OGL53085.1 MAG: hypothetical protein A3G31_09300 [Candidatus Schekmanbacteria bacterium RIFCSPLOWO2_12_FULL_38_15]OGL53788.1 MAG: hypothetical protein A3C43_04050 [Candidatus Schekmanbacteria bacterium RIFCSPHIGHO2_02_FULL_38_11]
MSSDTRVKVTDRCAKRVPSGHLWIFDNEIRDIGGSYSNGDIVSVFDSRGNFLAKGYINENSKIAIRILSFYEEEIGKEFFKNRIENALNHRLTLGFSLQDSFRVLFSEGDLLPGLTVDKYNNILSVQFSTFGMEVWKKEIIDILKEIFSPQAIIERSDIEVREKEGLEQIKNVLYGKAEKTEIIFQDGVRFAVDLLEGHKTGFYLDQRENRKFIKPFVNGKRVLDGFSYTGGFSLYSALYGASEIVAVEDSKKVMEMLNENIRINNLENRIKAIKGDAFQWMRDAYKNNERFDCVILDPPSFVKAKGAKGGALRGYKDINLLGLKLLKDRGYLLTASCSQNVSESEFLNVLNDSAKDAKCRLQIIEIRSQSSDHPILLSMPETHYLKFVVGRKVAMS